MGTTSPVLTSTDDLLVHLRVALMVALTRPTAESVWTVQETFEDLDRSLQDGRPLPRAWRTLHGR